MKRLLLIGWLALAAAAQAGVLVTDIDSGEGGVPMGIPFGAQTSDFARALGAIGMPNSLDARIRDARAQLAFRPRDAGAMARLGRLLLAANRMHEALQHFWQAARLRPNDPARVEEFAFALLASDDHLNGMKLYEALLKRAPDNLNAQFNLAAAYYHVARLSEAIELMRNFTEKNPAHARGWYNLGAMYLERGQLKQAAEALQKAEDIHPGQPYVLAATARLHRSANELAQYEASRQRLAEMIGREKAEALLAQTPMPVFLIR